MDNSIYPCLWFDGQAQDAAKFYCRIFKNSKITSDTPMVVNFELNGHKFMGLNGGPMFKFNEAISFVVDCNDQQEVDYYWDHLTAEGGTSSQCGWLKDKYGLSWQIVPKQLGDLMKGDAKKSQRVMQALMTMKKIEIAKLEEA
ncbi:MAG: VOC family protein [Cyclobacteriaceae bacterium]|nr:VOC family protein [Cyclobacteriaceae bacterium]